MLNIAGLRSFSEPGNHLGVVGFPITHSLSPVFQNAALREMAQQDSEFSSWQYHKIEASVESLAEVIKLTQEKGFRGLNLTIPHKVEVLPYLDQLDGVAERMGAVNTLKFGKDGVTGYNTDGYGIVSGIRSRLGLELKDRPVVILGAGGASRGACVQCLEEGCSQLLIGNRSQDRLEVLVQRLRGHYSDRKIEGFELGGEFPDIEDGAVLINATAVGLKADDPIPVDPEILDRVVGVYDMVYGQHTTPLVAEGLKRGLPSSDGLAMLVYQGARSLEIWSECEVPVEAMFQAIETHMQR